MKNSAPLSAAALVAGLASAAMHTPDGKCPLDRIDVTAVHLVPADRTPLPDWKDRAEYFARRLEQFHAREFGTQSVLRVTIRPEPFRLPRPAADLRAGDGNEVFWRTMNETRETLKWPDERAGFPILLVLSDINWRELDDFRREIVVDGQPRHEGHVAGDGRHFPGAPSGGARAVYHPAERLGLGLVSADGWRVPYSGSDCVVYHEGVGHPLGLPHPNPMDDSVMGTAQYHHWLHQTRINPQQKTILGWRDEPSGFSNRLFSAFTALPDPLVPKPGEPARLRLTWPDGARDRRVAVEVQTELFGPWHRIPDAAVHADLTAADLGAFDRPTPVSYRVRAQADGGQAAEIWGYFQVRPAR